MSSVVSTPARAVEKPQLTVAQSLAPPHNIEAEESVLGAILLSERTMYSLVIEEGLRPEDFYRDRHRADLRGDARPLRALASRSTR